MPSWPESNFLVRMASLDPQHEPSEAVRWIYGASFVQLAYLEHQWAAEQAPAIFPASPAERRFWEEAWDAYLTYAPVLPDVYAILYGR